MDKGAGSDLTVELPNKERTQASKDHVPLYLEKENSPVDESRLNELLASGVAATAGVDADWLEAQAKVRRARREVAGDGGAQEPPQKRPKTRGRPKKAATKPVESGAPPPMESSAPQQPMESSAPQKPMESSAPRQPIEEGAAEPIEEGATEQSSIEEGAAEPIEKGATEQSIEEGATEQSIEEGAAQPIEGAPSQSIEEGAPSQSIEEGAPQQPSMVTGGAVGLPIKTKKGEAPSLLQAGIPLPAGYGVESEMLHKSYTIKYDGPGDHKNISTIGVLWANGQLYVNRVMNAKAAGDANVNINKKKGATVNARKKKGWLPVFELAKQLGGWP
ncbi:unnamed protein product [Symbiodinium sp. CCMP2592]|nr:unnamed protein product [Symbiodinium sp. CCMP2592]